MKAKKPSKALEKFSDEKLIEKLRARGNALTIYDADYLENVGVKPKDCRKEFDEIRYDLEDYMSFEANRWLDNKFRDLQQDVWTFSALEKKMKKR